MEEKPLNDCNFDVFKINNVAIKNPSTIKYTRSALDDGDSTYRDINGILQRNVIRKDVVKLECSWNSGKMTPEEVSTLLTSVNDDFFWLEYYDPYDLEVARREFYVSYKTLEAYRYKDTDKPVWKTISFNFIAR